MRKFAPAKCEQSLRMLHRLAFAPSDQRRIPVWQQDSDWSDIHLCLLKFLSNNFYEEHYLFPMIHMLTSFHYQAFPLALNFIASGECSKAQRMLLHVEEWQQQWTAKSPQSRQECQLTRRYG